MKLGIRFKLLVILLLASVLPLALGITSLVIFGNRYYRANQGLLFRSAAGQLSQALSLTANNQIEKLSDWIKLSAASRRVRLLNRFSPAPRDIAAIESQWPHLTAGDAPLNTILENDLSRELWRFRNINPLFREIFVTDARGRILASTNKTSDYLQSDETWWQKAKASPPHVAWLEGISYDESAKTHSLDVALCLRNEDTGAFLGVVKGVLNVSALFAQLPQESFSNDAAREVVLGDGRILAQLFNPKYVPLSNRYRGFSHIISRAQGWMTTVLDPAFPRTPDERNVSELIGIAPLRLEGIGTERVAVDGLTPMYVVVREPESSLLAPMQHLLIWLGVTGGGLILAFALAGIWIADRKIVTPVRLLGRAARSVAQTARNNDNNDGLDPATQLVAREAVQRCHNIHTGDEISGLAEDFALMAEKVLHYHSQLEKEIAEKTGAIRRDLEMAREFQESLLPREYPQISNAGAVDAISSLTLNFHHYYQPALTVGGDFFDIFRLSDHKIGIFIADVMGHGARSALVTAILHTLLQDLTAQTSDPAELLRLINHHFHHTVHGSRQFVFVSAFCLVIDTQAHTAAYASAGHPSPLLAKSGDAPQVLPLLGYAGGEGIHSNAALGLATDSTYECYSRPIDAGDAFLLYTDGVVEAPAPDGNEFGMVRLEQAVQKEMAQRPSPHDVGALCDAVIDAVTGWMQGTPSPDDICLVVVGIDSESEPAVSHSSLPDTQSQ